MKTQNVGYNQAFGSVYLPINKKTTKWIKECNDSHGFEYIHPIDNKYSTTEILHPKLYYGIPFDVQFMSNDFMVQEIDNYYKIVGRNFDKEIELLGKYKDISPSGKLVPDHPSIDIYKALKNKQVSVEDIKDAVKRKRLDGNQSKELFTRRILKDYAELQEVIKGLHGVNLVRRCDLPKPFQLIIRK